MASWREDSLLLISKRNKSIFDGRYSWDGIKRDQREPIAWFPGAYDLKIVDLTIGKENITFLKPYLCIYTNTGSGYSISENPEKFAKNICHDFALQMDKVLWVEQTAKGKDLFEVITFKKCGMTGEDPIYLTVKRKARDNEIRLIKKGLAE